MPQTSPSPDSPQPVPQPLDAAPASPVLAEPPASAHHWGQLYGCAPALAIAEAAQRHASLTLVVVPGMAEALALEQALRFFTGGALPVLGLPDWETLPYDRFSPHQDIVSQRLETLYRLPHTARGILLLPVSTLLQRLAPPSFLDGQVLLVRRGERLSREALRERLARAGYRRVEQVLEHGEYALRGSLLDLFPMASETPLRLDFFDDELESIRSFSADDQRSIEQVDEVRLLPAHEFPFNDEAIATFRAAFREQFPPEARNSPLYRDVSNGLLPTGIEYYLPLFFQHGEEAPGAALACLADYLPAGAQILAAEGCADAAAQFWEQLEARHEERRHDIERPILPPAALYQSIDEGLAPLRAAAAVQLGSFERDGADVCNFATAAPGSYPVQARAESPLQLLKHFLADFDGSVLLSGESAGRREALSELLHDNGLRPRPVAGWTEFVAAAARGDGDAAGPGGGRRLYLAAAPLDSGLLAPQTRLGHGLAIICESQLLGERARQTRRARRDTRDADAIIRNLTDLSIGAPVVHIDHGVGRYQGLVRLDVGGVEAEFLMLEYAGSDKLYVPVSALQAISRYTGASEEGAPLHKLGGEQWTRIKRKAAEKARDVAAELLEIHARRAARRGHAFPARSGNYDDFAANFPFEETPDQAQAIDAVLADMRREQPMDRVVCGDVGFGKTEVAMRAAFAAVDGGKQVAVLVPTTLLAQQHHNNFSDRFADWPVRVESLSRFRSKAQQDAVLAALKAGRVDIVIGTHKLLQSGIDFANLGLVIVDEEHRFGVRHKERLKALRAEVDLLTLTATPIPRTLNMSLSGLRDLSIIATPPAHRHAIKTFVGEWSDQQIREACQRELSRGGQVYFLHNEVKSIERTARQIEEIVPEASVRFAHGQMRESELESAMLNFYHQRFNVLVATTIIESGIDIPTANTIIINRADKLGLAQLHQLRGRVGRSHHRAYAYLLVPPRSLITADAQKRLEAIESLEDLGVGFTLATHDLEIRGAGELLGEGQSGQIHEIGFTLYSELLDRAVKALKRGELPDTDATQAGATEVELQLPALLPDDYVPDVHNRLILYKRIASAADDAALRELKVELIDRFGLLPEASKTLFEVSALKLRCEALGIRKLEAGARGGRLLFTARPRFEPIALIRLVQTEPTAYRFDGGDVLRFSADLAEPAARLEFLDRLLACFEAEPLVEADA